MEVVLTTGIEATRDLYTDVGQLRGVWTRGESPKQLVLSDGSRLDLQHAESGPVLWRRTESGDGDRVMSVSEALEVAGEEFSGYVAVRTRSEAEWLRAVAEWCSGEADRLEGELSGSPSG